MASTPRLPERTRASIMSDVGNHVSELASDLAGALSPYGQDLEFPLPVEQLRYTHPSPADRPHLADGR